MPKTLTLEEGRILTQFARQTIESYIREEKRIDLPQTTSETLFEKRGVFVTLKKHTLRDDKGWMLRGCIGRLPPEPNSQLDLPPLLEATRQAALSSALEDPRFPPVRREELDSILVEVSVLTVPEELKVKDRTNLAAYVTVGQDGLVIEGKGWHRGLLLPQVAPEQGWSAEEFLQGCCQKAGLPINCYLNPDIKIYKFQAQIFAETTVKGKIVERTF